MTLTGRWAKEMQPQRHALGTARARAREPARHAPRTSRRPRSAVGTPAFGEQSGEVWLAHLAWSGNHRAVASRRCPTAAASLSLVRAAAAGRGAARRRARRTRHPRCSATLVGHGSHHRERSSSTTTCVPAPATRSTPRPVLLNTWEAVYFNHDVAELQRLADAAAAVGVERFVLDDGWFRGRDDDTSSLGDWYVDERKYPDGLGELADHVVGLGLEFGLWVEPEMVNPDSDLYRAHPEWVAAASTATSRCSAATSSCSTSAAPRCRRTCSSGSTRCSTEHPIALPQVGQNRDLVAAGAPRWRGRRTPADARALRAARRAAPAPPRRRDRVVLVRRRADRPRDRRAHRPLLDVGLQRRARAPAHPAQVLLPAAARAHGRARRRRVVAHHRAHADAAVPRARRRCSATSGSSGTCSHASAEDRAGVAQVIEVHKRFRPLLHSGRVVRVDHPDPSALVHGVVARDGREALFCYAQLTATDATMPAPARLVGPRPGAPLPRRAADPAGRELGPGQRHHPSWYDAPSRSAATSSPTVGPADRACTSPSPPPSSTSPRV